MRRMHATDMRISVPIKFKISAILLLVLVSLGSYAVFHFREMVDHDTWHVKTLNREITADGARMFDDIVDRTFSLLQGLARHPAVVNHDSRSAHRLFIEVLAGEPYLLNIIAVDRDGRMFGSAIDPEGAQRMSHRDSPWFREALKRPVVGDFHISRPGNTPTLMVAMPVRDAGGKVVGALAAPLLLEYVGRAITRGLLLQDRAFLQVINAGGTVILDTSGRPDGRSAQYPAGSADGEIIDKSGGKKDIIMVMPMMHGGLRAVVGMPVEEAYRDASAFGARFLSIFFAIGGAALTAGLFFARRIGKRLAEVMGGMREMEQGNLAVRLAPKGHDELRYVAERFNAMADARELAERALKLKEEQIGRHLAVQSSLNDLLQRSNGNASIDELLQHTLESVLNLPGLTLEPKGAVFLADETGALVMRASHGLSDHARNACASVQSGECVCGRAAASQEIEFAGRIDERHEIRYEGIAPHGHYCVPIVFDGRTLGVMALHLSEGHARSGPEEDILRTFVGALAGTIQRKRMQEERERLVQELQNLVQQVTRAKREWQATFDAITDPVSIHDKDFRVIRANKAFSEHVGLKPEEVILRKCHEMMHNTCSPLERCPHKVTLEDVKSHTEEVLDPRTGRTFSVSTFPFFAEGGEFLGSVHIAKDITEKIEQEKLLAVTERFAGLGRMASGIAHEINNPLAAISGCAEALLTRVGRNTFDPGLFKQYLSIVQEEIIRCKNITTAMLSFVRRESGEKKELDIHAVVLNVLDLVGFQGRLRNVEVVDGFAPDLPAIYGSEGELRQVFLTLITNAIDAMEERGRITISTRRNNGSVEVSVGDTGSGIPPEYLDRIFEPFFTTKGDRGGNGLGLAVARRIVMNHDGAISVVLSENTGTTFSVVLPCSPA